ncbi:MAG: hypothetical protein IJ068_02625 [Bacilli bacterium]|nr:hypothetical protein [Bacilli bacterium]
MRILKDERLLKEYIYPILAFPAFCLLVKLIFQIGRIYGTFLREVLPLVIKNI